MKFQHTIIKSKMSAIDGLVHLGPLDKRHTNVVARIEVCIFQKDAEKLIKTACKGAGDALNKAAEK